MARVAHAIATAYLARLVTFTTLAAVVGLWVVFAGLSIPVIPDHGSDFAIYYAAAKALRLTPNANIYTWETLTQTVRTYGGCALYPPPHVLYVYLPLLAILLRPLTLLPCEMAVEVWHAGNLVLWALSMALLAGNLARRWPNHRMLAAALAMLASAFYWPLAIGYWVGQVHIAVLFGILLTFWLIERDRLLLAGAVLALLALIKVLPAILILYYLVRGRWRVVVGAAVAGGILAGVMLAVVGVSGVLAGARAIMAFDGRVADDPLNVSLATVPVVGHTLLGLVAGVFVVGLWLARQRGDDRLGYAWAICTMLLVSPLVWGFYLAWLLPVFVVCLGAVGTHDWRIAAALVLLYLALAFPVAITIAGAVPLATLMLWALAGAMFMRSGPVDVPSWVGALRRRVLSWSPEAA